MSPSNKKSFHIGLLGHIDAGKTELARRLTEVVSTAGLDKHKQSQERGITIDMGFTFFNTEKYIVTLVDAPGHADLIQSVISCANIIDIAFLVVDAREGFQVQTGEHLIILDLLKIPFLYVIINKIELIDELNLGKLQKQIKTILLSTHFKNNYKIFSISAKENINIKELKSDVIDYINLNPPKRENTGDFRFLIDHHFKKKGYGTILTGTATKGNAMVGEEIVILPQNAKCVLKTIQKAKKSMSRVEAGDRCGIAVAKLKDIEISRGNFATKKDNSFQSAYILDVKIHQTPLFKHEVSFGQQITVNHQMNSMSGRIFPYKIIQNDSTEILFLMDTPKKEKEYNAILWLDEGDFFKIEDELLLSRLDFGPKQLRVLGLAHINKFSEEPIFFVKEKIKKGIVINSDYTNNSVIVEGLVQSKKGAQSIKGSKAEYPFGLIKGTFGQKSKVEVELDKKISSEERKQIVKGTEVHLKVYKKIKILCNKSYK